MSDRLRNPTGSLVLAELREELDRIFREIVSATEALRQTGDWSPPSDILDRGDHLLVLLEIPGVDARDLDVTIADSILSIKGRRRLEFPRSGNVKFQCLERQEGSFERRVEVRVPVDFSRAEAVLYRGILSVSLPKIEDRRRRVHTVEVAEREEEGDDG